MWAIAIDGVAWSVCTILGADFGGPKEPCTRWGPDPKGKGQFWGCLAH